MVSLPMVTCMERVFWRWVGDNTKVDSTETTRSQAQWKPRLEHMRDHLLKGRCQAEEDSHGTMVTFTKVISDSTRCTVMEQWNWKTDKFIQELGKMVSTLELTND